MIGVNDNTLQILQEGLKNTVSIHRETLNPTSRRHCDDKPADGKEHASEEDPRSDEETNKYQEEDKNTHVVDRIVRHIGAGPRLWNVVRW